MEIVNNTYSVSIDQILLIFLTGVIGVVSYLFTRSVNQLDERMKRYDERLMRHDAQIAELNSDIKALQTAMNINLTQISKKLDEIDARLHEWDVNAKNFYATYDLTKKQ